MGVDTAIETEMQPLSTAKLMMIWLSVDPADDLTTTPGQRFGYIVHTLVVLIMSVICFFACVAYCSKYYSIDFDGAAFGFMGAVGELWLIYFLIAALRMRQQIGNVFMGLSTIYKNSKFNFIEYSKCEKLN